MRLIKPTTGVKMNDNDCIFQIPPHICEELGIVDERDEFKEYMVKKNGELYLPWKHLYKLGNWNVPYAGDMMNANSLLDMFTGEEREECEEMIAILIDFHENKFDNQKGLA
jgi:hypothetical protein